MCCFIVLDARSRKPRFWQCHSPSDTCRFPSLSLPSVQWFSSILWHSLPCRCITPILCVPMAFFLCLFLSSSLCASLSLYPVSPCCKDTGHTGLTLMTSVWLNLQRPCFLNTEYWGFGLQLIFLGEA